MSKSIPDFTQDMTKEGMQAWVDKFNEGFDKEMECMNTAYDNRTRKMNVRLQKVENTTSIIMDMMGMLLEKNGVDMKPYKEKLQKMNSKIDSSEYN